MFSKSPRFGNSPMHSEIPGPGTYEVPTGIGSPLHVSPKGKRVKNQKSGLLTPSKIDFEDQNHDPSRRSVSPSFTKNSRESSPAVHHRETPLHDISNMNAPAITVSAEPSPSHPEFMAKTKPYETVIQGLKTKLAISLQQLNLKEAELDQKSKLLKSAQNQLQLYKEEELENGKRMLEVSEKLEAKSEEFERLSTVMEQATEELKQRSEQVGALELEIQTMRSSMVEWENKYAQQITECVMKDSTILELREKFNETERLHRARESELVTVIQQHEEKVAEKEAKAHEIYLRLEARNQKQLADVQKVRVEEQKAHEAVVEQLQQAVEQARATAARELSRVAVVPRARQPQSHFMSVALPGLLITFVISFGVYWTLQFTIPSDQKPPS